MNDAPKNSLDRRKVLRGAAWATPVIAAAVATPAAAATPPACPTCITPMLGAWTAQAIVLNNTGAVAFATAFGLDATACGLLTNIFQPAFTYIITQATLTMSDNSVHTITGLGTGNGVLGAVGVFPGLFTFGGVSFPNGGAVAGSYPVAPKTLSVTIQATLQWGVGATLLCPLTLTWNLNGLATGIVATVPVVGPVGAGTLNFTGVSTQG